MICQKMSKSSDVCVSSFFFGVYQVKNVSTSEKWTKNCQSTSVKVQKPKFKHKGTAMNNRVDPEKTHTNVLIYGRVEGGKPSINCAFKLSMP